MRVFAVLLFVGLTSGCLAPYPSEVSKWVTDPDPMPPNGTGQEELEKWFAEEGYQPGPVLWLAASELRGGYQNEWSHAQAGERTNWLSVSRSIVDFCTTVKRIYYRYDASGKLADSVQRHDIYCN